MKLRYKRHTRIGFNFERDTFCAKKTCILRAKIKKKTTT